MKDPLQLSVKKFLESHLDPKRPLVLAYSGGPDSKALLHLLLSLKERFGLDLHAAHVDHSWRQGSDLEAKVLGSEVALAGIPFHLLTLDPSQVPLKNREALARGERLAFFKRLALEIDAQAVILAHHAGDLAETVLKRLFEGAHLRHISGMSSIGELEGMTVWRPLLYHTKDELVRWLEKRNLQAIVDATNTDPQFLRGRMRTQLLPFLSDAFGKGIQDNLCYLSRSAADLTAYFSQKLAPCFKTLEKGSAGVVWDLSTFSLEKIEWEYLLKEWLSQEKLVLSRHLFQRCIEALNGRKKKETIPLEQGVLQIESGFLTFNYL